MLASFIGAGLTGGTSNVVTGVSDTFAFFASVTIWAGFAFAKTCFGWVFDTLAVFARFIFATSYFGAGLHTLAFTTELITTARFVRTGVTNAGSADTSLTRGAAFDVAVVLDTSAFSTNVARGAVDQDTGVNTTTTHTLLVCWTFLTLASIAVADVVDTLHATGTFCSTTLGTTASLHTVQTCGTGCTVVGLSVAVVVSAVANFGSW